MPNNRVFQAVAQQVAPEVGATWSLYIPDTEGYAQAAAATFPFFRVHSSGKYSSRTLMRLAALADEDTKRGLPIILSAGTPFSYDEDTEQKRGGTVGMCVWWPDEDGRCLLAVGAGARRKRIGTAFLRFLHGDMSYLGWPSLWVARTNVEAQTFLLQNGLMPSAINSNGAVRYSAEKPEEGETNTPEVAWSGRRQHVEPTPAVWQVVESTGTGGVPGAFYGSGDLDDTIYSPSELQPWG